jgi:integrase
MSFAARYWTHPAKHHKSHSFHNSPPPEEIRSQKRPHAFLAEKGESLFRGSLKADFGADAVHPKTEGTTSNTQQIVLGYLIPAGDEIAGDIKPLDLQRWLKSLHSDKGLAWTTVSKIRGVLLRIYKVGILHELVSKNPAQPVETRSTTNYRAIIITPQQTRSILSTLSTLLHRILVFTCAATALRSSELLALR